MPAKTPEGLLESRAAWEKRADRGLRRENVPRAAWVAERERESIKVEWIYKGGFKKGMITHKTRRDDPQATAPRTTEIVKRRAKFHRSGICNVRRHAVSTANNVGEKDVLA
jgi:hypothetical protein